MSTKDEAVKSLIDWHFQIDPEMTLVRRFLAANEEDPREPIKLLEVSPATPASGSVMTFAFGPTPEIPYPSVFATVTPEEMEQIEHDQISLPIGWRLDHKQDFTAPPPLPSRNGKH